jgi:hypothetical protein
MNKYSLSALVAAGLLATATTSASAADLGGNCCADLEERIAELEATTARKGNRKVSLTISGWVNQQITAWDDGVESNIYIHDLGSTLGSHVKFTGQATIAPGYSAGYVLHIEAMGSDGLTTSANNDNGVGVYTLTSGAAGTNSAVQVIQSYWFVKSETLGKVSVGQQSQASDNTAILVDGSGSLVSANWVAFDVNSFAVRNNGGVALSWGGAGPCGGMGGAWGDCNGLTRNTVRYDSPSFGGFSVSAGWGEDDFWDVAARYAGEFSGIKVALSAAYNEVTDESFNGAFGTPNDTGKYFQAGAYLQHVPTGLFVLGNYGHLSADIVTGTSETWYVKAGIRTRLSSLGSTVFYGEYLQNQADQGYAAGAAAATDSELQVYGAGIVQEVDAAAMSVWLKYRNLSFDDNTAVTYQDFDYVGLGAIINF